MSGISGSTRMCCLFGDPVEHSKSPMLHNTAFEKTGLNYAYLAFDIKAENIKDAVEAARALNFTGFNLTMPHKITVMDYLDKLDPAAELIKTVNTVRNDNGVLTGFNTDGYGMMKAFREHGATIEGKKWSLWELEGPEPPLRYRALLMVFTNWWFFLLKAEDLGRQPSAALLALTKIQPVRLLFSIQPTSKLYENNSLTQIYSQTARLSEWAHVLDRPLFLMRAICTKILLFRTLFIHLKKPNFFA